VPIKQKGKKQGKGTVKSGDGFVNIDYEHSRAKLASGFTTRKDLEAGLTKMRCRRY
jgi:hypothetical protein